MFDISNKISILGLLFSFLNLFNFYEDSQFKPFFEKSVTFLNPLFSAIYKILLKKILILIKLVCLYQTSLYIYYIKTN